MQNIQDLNAQQQAGLIQARLAAENRLRGGATWFWWIAGLSIINSIVMLSGGEWNFVLGLAITQFIDAIAQLLTEEAGRTAGIVIMAIGLGLNAIIAGFFVLFGFLARKGMIWSFIIGMVIYALDGLIILWLGSWLSVGFHAFALFGLYNGLMAARDLQNMARVNPLPTL